MDTTSRRTTANILDEICLVVDFDGFFVGKNFVVRELGYCATGGRSWENESIRFNLKKSASLMSEKDFKTNNYVKKHITGMTIRPIFKEKCEDEEKLPEILETLYNENKSPKRYVVAYKGGIHERDLLEKLNIPSYNIENSGCPRMDVIIEDFLLKDVAHILSCGYHAPVGNESKIPHCAKFETFCFARWILIEILVQKGIKKDFSKDHTLLRDLLLSTTKYVTPPSSVLTKKGRTENKKSI